MRYDLSYKWRSTCEGDPKLVFVGNTPMATAQCSLASLKNVMDKWFLEADASSPTKQKVLVGMKADLRENRDMVDYRAQKRLQPVSDCNPRGRPAPC